MMGISDGNNLDASSETAKGKEAMENKDFEGAIEHFGSALQLVIEQRDGQEDHPDTAPYYARYGKALLEAAVRSASVSLVNEAAVEKNYGGEVDESGKVILLSEDEMDEEEDLGDASAE